MFVFLHKIHPHYNFTHSLKKHDLRLFSLLCHQYLSFSNTTYLSLLVQCLKRQYFQDRWSFSLSNRKYTFILHLQRDNIPGFLALSRPLKATNLEIILSFTPESQLSTEELKIYQQVDVEDIQLNLDSLNYKHGKALSSRIVSKPSQSLLLGYSFNTPLLYVYSIQFRKPSHGFWHGSIIINTQDGEKLPILFFHDNESALTLKNQKLQNQRFDPFGNDGDLYWGGTDFLNALEALINVQRSTIEPSVYLINPESNDLRNFAPSN